MSKMGERLELASKVIGFLVNLLKLFGAAGKLIRFLV
jgi:hypothetical protein